MIFTKLKDVDSERCIGWMSFNKNEDYHQWLDDKGFDETCPGSEVYYDGATCICQEVNTNNE